MELRHLRYFIAVAEEGSLTNAAERRLHTAQPSLSRPIRALAISVGAKLLERGARGITLTPPGRVFLEHGRLAMLPAGHRLAAGKDIRLQDCAGEPYITPTRVAPALKAVIDAYAAKSGVALKPAYDAENLSSAMSLVASTGGVTLLPLYARNLLSPAVVIRPLQGPPPTIDLVMGYNRANTSPLLKRFLARADELVARVSQQGGAAMPST